MGVEEHLLYLEHHCDASVLAIRQAVKITDQKESSFDVEYARYFVRAVKQESSFPASKWQVILA